MRTWALVPIKPRALCKSRLASVLPPTQREALVCALLKRVLATLRSTPEIDQIALLSSGHYEVVEGVRLLPDQGSELNVSLEAGVDQAIAEGASTVLIIPADLPWLCVNDVRILLAKARLAGIALAPDRHERGTNALCMQALFRMSLQFGNESFSKHCEAAARLGLPAAAGNGIRGSMPRFDEASCIRTRGLGFDLDTAADWHWLVQYDSDYLNVFLPTADTPSISPTNHQSAG